MDSIWSPRPDCQCSGDMRRSQPANAMEAAVSAAPVRAKPSVVVIFCRLAPGRRAGHSSAGHSFTAAPAAVSAPAVTLCRRSRKMTDQPARTHVMRSKRR